MRTLPSQEFRSPTVALALILIDWAMLEAPSSCERIRPVASEQHITRGKELQENEQMNGALKEFLRAAAVDPVE